MLPINWNTATKYASLISIAESVSPSGSYDQTHAAQIKTIGYAFLQTLYGDELATDVDPHIGEVVSFGFFAVSDGSELVVALRGTDTIWEWLHDASFLMVPCSVIGAQGFTEDGFTAVYGSLRIGQNNASLSARDSIKGYLDSGAATKVTVCGHSLGGALATLLVIDVGLNTSCRAPTAYTYASPRVGDHIFASSYNSVVSESYRIANRQDLVPKLPPILPLPYYHVDTQYELNPPLNAINPTIPCMHYMNTYRWLIGQLVGSSGTTLDSGCLGPGTLLV